MIISRLKELDKRNDRWPGYPAPLAARKAEERPGFHAKPSHCRPDWLVVGDTDFSSNRWHGSHLAHTIITRLSSAIGSGRGRLQLALQPLHVPGSILVTRNPGSRDSVPIFELREAQRDNRRGLMEEYHLLGVLDGQQIMVTIAQYGVQKGDGLQCRAGGGCCVEGEAPLQAKNIDTTTT